MSAGLGERGAVATPALVLDLEAMERNIATMMRRAQEMGVSIRPHAKSHKCAEIARRLRKAGAVGACCATIGEAEALAAAGIEGLLITSPMSTPTLIERVERLVLRGADLMLVVDSPSTLAPLAAVASAAGRQLPLIVELDVGVGRTGCRSVEAAVELARLIASTAGLAFAGVQAYWGNLQQVMPFEEREQRVAVQADRLRTLIEALRGAGVAPGIVTGSGTGTHAIDGRLGLFTELQPGSFLFLDSCYGAVPLGRDGNPFEASLFVAASVISANDPDRAIVDAGWKAFATDSGLPRPMRGAPQGATYRYMGDEHGAVEGLGEAPLAIGDRVELQVSHCDPTVNLHRHFVVVRGDRVVDHWTILARGYGATP
jgi:D-serine deaminase-like pyridoxal phosphate-dependent protein